MNSFVVVISLLALSLTDLMSAAGEEVDCEYNGEDFDSGYGSVHEYWECRADGSAVCTKTVETCEPCKTKGTKTTGSRIYMNTGTNTGEAFVEEASAGWDCRNKCTQFSSRPGRWSAAQGRSSLSQGKC